MGRFASTEFNVGSEVHREFLPYMRKKKWGRVIMIASSAAKYPNAALIDYGATSSSNLYEQVLGEEIRTRRVLVNSVFAD